MSQVQMFNEETAPSGNNGYMTEDDLFKRLVQLETDKMVAAADIAQIKKDAKYDEDENPYGIDKDQIPLIHDAAKFHAKKDFEEKKLKAKLVFAKYEELTGYSS
jgi:hypothetical protein